MSHRRLAVVGSAVAIAGLFLVQVPVIGQGPGGPVSKIPGLDPNYKAPRTPWGTPDIQGILDGGSIAPQARPAKFADREFLTDQEVKALEKAALDEPGRDARGQAGTHADLEGAYNDVFTHRRENYAVTKRTGLIVDPPNGQMPPMKADAAPSGGRGGRGGGGGAGGGGGRGGRAPVLSRDGKPLGYSIDTEEVVAEHPEHRRADRCSGVGYSPSAVQRLVQGPDSVMIYTENAISGGAYRIIHLKPMPVAPPELIGRMGHSVGRWEGDTLVVETSHLPNNPNIRYTSYYTRVSDDLLLLRQTTHDPNRESPWTVEYAMRILPNKENQIYESSCHEGNYSLTAILAGARALEREEAAAKKTQKR